MHVCTHFTLLSANLLLRIILAQFLRKVESGRSSQVSKLRAGSVLRGVVVEEPVVVVRRRRSRRGRGRGLRGTNGRGGRYLSVQVHRSRPAGVGQMWCGESCGKTREL